MSLSERLPAAVVVAVLVGGAAIAGWNMFGGGDDAAASVTVHVPDLSPQAAAGKVDFDANCALCHGINGAGGTGKGPPLIHAIYNPGHHSDAAFYYAAANGVRQHHWLFGNMPPQPQVSEGQMAGIVAYIRELQVANGIVYQEHRM